VQREQLIDYVAQNQIGRLCFMTGDMHSSYHLTMSITSAGGIGAPPLLIHELMASPVNQFPGGSHGFIEKPMAQTTSTGVTYLTSPLNDNEFYGTDSNVMIVKYTQATKTVDWTIHSTKDPAAAAVPGNFVL
jgi:phosphodiesterase/alkaline phosphatase D-like protein